MKNMRTIKNVTLFVMLVGGLFSCQKETQEPVLNIKFNIEKTEKFKYAEVTFSQLFLFGKSEDNDMFKSNLQGYNKKVSDGFLLSKGGSTQTITSHNHFEMEVTALEPDVYFYLHKSNGDVIERVWEKINGSKINLNQSVTLEANQIYDVVININLDEAIIEDANNLQIDWGKVTADIIKK